MHKIRLIKPSANMDELSGYARQGKLAHKEESKFALQTSEVKIEHANKGSYYVAVTYRFGLWELSLACIRRRESTAGRRLKGELRFDCLQAR